jgi:hypothetical protein
MEKSKLAQRAYEEGRHVSWREARVVQTESDNTCKKHKESLWPVCPVWTLPVTFSVLSLEGSYKTLPLSSCAQFRYKPAIAFFIWCSSGTLCPSDARDLLILWNSPYNIFDGNVLILFSVLWLESIAVLTLS